MSESPSPSIDLYPRCQESLPERELRDGAYRVRFARSYEELDQILRLRFEVFNLELGEGLDSAFETGLDLDQFDPVCHHLMVLDDRDDRLVGSYRLQTSEMASRHLGFYSQTEFQLSGLPRAVLDSSLEIGRACVARSHRSKRVLFLLWRGLALYVAFNRKRYLFGCSSLTSQDPHEGKALIDHLTAEGHMHPEVRVLPQPGYEVFEEGFESRPGALPETPALLKTYLRHGAKVCGPPAIDRLFKTIDYFVLFDVDAMPQRMFETFFEE
jgi:putative hemolysin